MVPSWVASLPQPPAAGLGSWRCSGRGLEPGDPVCSHLSPTPVQVPLQNSSFPISWSRCSGLFPLSPSLTAVPATRPPIWATQVSPMPWACSGEAEARPGAGGLTRFCLHPQQLSAGAWPWPYPDCPVLSWSAWWPGPPLGLTVFLRKRRRLVGGRDGCPWPVPALCSLGCAIHGWLAAVLHCSWFPRGPGGLAWLRLWCQLPARHRNVSVARLCGKHQPRHWDGGPQDPGPGLASTWRSGVPALEGTSRGVGQSSSMDLLCPPAHPLTGALSWISCTGDPLPAGPGPLGAGELAGLSGPESGVPEGPAGAVPVGPLPCLKGVLF